MRPVNIASKKAYRGVNVLALWATAEEKAYTSGIWGTYKQWSEAGAQVRKGEKSAYVVFYKEITVAADDDGDGETRHPSLRPATPVFAAEQVDGWTRARHRRARDRHHADRAGRGLCRRDRRNDHPRRQPGLLSPLDRQHSPSPARGLHRTATSSPAEAYYSTLLHELTPLSPATRAAAIGSLASVSAIDAYAMEELVAELGAAFLCADLGSPTSRAPTTRNISTTG